MNFVKQKKKNLHNIPQASNIAIRMIIKETIFIQMICIVNEIETCLYGRDYFVRFHLHQHDFNVPRITRKICDEIGKKFKFCTRSTYSNNFYCKNIACKRRSSCCRQVIKSFIDSLRNTLFHDLENHESLFFE